VVLVEAREILRDRRDLDEIGGIPRSTQRDRRLVEEEVDVDRLVRLAVAARLGLRDEAYDGGEALGQCRLISEIRGSRRRHDERDEREGGEQGSRSVTVHRTILAV
jgi:hypothetical protein